MISRLSASTWSILGFLFLVLIVMIGFLLNYNFASAVSVPAWYLLLIILSWAIFSVSAIQRESQLTPAWYRPIFALLTGVILAITLPLMPGESAKVFQTSAIFFWFVWGVFSLTRVIAR